MRCARRLSPRFVAWGDITKMSHSTSVEDGLPWAVFRRIAADANTRDPTWMVGQDCPMSLSMLWTLRDTVILQGPPPGNRGRNGPKVRELLLSRPTCS